MKDALPRHSMRTSRPAASEPATSGRHVLIAGRYRVERPLGKGGMASVWAVVDEATGGKLALKRLPKTANAKLVALFEREFHTLASLHSPCIVKAYDYAKDAEGPFYTMELLEGSDVSSLAPMPWNEVARVLRDVASALTLLHARRVIHRDLSARNVWRTAEGLVKLIDFGTMATFGKPAELVGTPPFIAPESLHSLELDQRTDLYALGALGYFLLSGRHAFPARSLQELEVVWRDPPRPVSKRVSELGRSDLGEVPEPFEALLNALLSRDPLARPTTAADVIDRLTVIASLKPVEQDRVLDSYLRSAAFVGREPEREALRRAHALARSGRAASVVVQSAPGLGRTRLLAEFALEARLSGAVVLQAEGHGNRGTHEVALEYAHRLLEALPAEALAAAAPHASTLGHLGASLREKLGVPAAQLAVMPQAHGEARMRVQAALRDWFLDVARERRLVIVADDLDAFDDGSAAWLGALGREALSHRLLIVASVSSDRAPFSLSVSALCQSAIRLELGPLSTGAMTELFRSVFGHAQRLARLVELLHERSEGNPAHAVELAEHLSREGLIAFIDGGWELPGEIGAHLVPENRLEAELARIKRLPAGARQLGQELSVRDGPIPLDMCAAISELQGQALFEALEALVREGVLVGSEGGYRFRREASRRKLYAELAPSHRQTMHRRLGKLLLASPGITELERLKAGVHLLRGGEEEAGSLAVAAAGKHYGLVELADLGPAAASLEAALEHFRAARRSPHELVTVLAPLALAGYYADRNMAVRYGEQAVDALKGIVGLKRARRLRPFLGRKASLLVALLVAAIGFALRRRNPRVPTFREAMMLLFNCVAALTGVCTVCIDPEGGEEYASVLEPMTALGPNHVATFMHQFCMNLVGTIRDHVGAARENWARMLARLDRPNAVRDLPEHAHVLYLAGALYASGVIECWRDDSRALEYANRLDAFKLKLYEMSADQVRMMYYANRGNIEQFERYRQKVEVHAIQRGTAWQVETWTYSGLITVFARTGDAARLKECVERLKRESASMRSLRFAYGRALGAYLVMRGTPSEALKVIGQGERPMGLVGWSRGQGLRARALNALGEHVRAKETCLETLGHLTPADLEYCALNLGVQVELARAEGALGNLEEAEARLRQLLEAHGPGGNPLSVGAIHEALAELAALRGDEAAFTDSVDEVGRRFRETRDPALVARHERLARLSRTQSAQRASDSPRGRSSRPPRVMTVLHRLRHGGDHTRSGSASWALKQISELTGSREAYLFLTEDDDLGCAARLGDADDEAAIAEWVRERLLSLGANAAMATRTTDDPAGTTLHIDDRVYRLTVLSAPGAAGDVVLGAFAVTGPGAVPSPVIQTIAERLRVADDADTGETALMDRTLVPADPSSTAPP